MSFNRPCGERGSGGQSTLGYRASLAAWGSQCPKRPGRGKPRLLCHRVFDSLHRASSDNLPSWLSLEYCWLLGERIDAFPRLCGGLLDDNEFGESGHKEGACFLEFFIADAGE